MNYQIYPGQFPIPFSASFSATAKVFPEPQKKSATKSPHLMKALKILSLILQVLCRKSNTFAFYL
jgi:hypothetical protein